MDHPLHSLIDQIVQNADRNGAFDNLPGAGEPLAQRENPRDAVLDRLMTEAGAKPMVLVLKESIAASKARLAPLSDEAARKAEMKILADLELRLALELEALRRYG